ncbi:Uncharacterised protein [uncultured archaeon]|nr:Uncharacterised protein [uncultured archaeon]
MKIELHIEELVLHGFEPGDRYCIAEALERELSSLIANQGIPRSFKHGGETERMDGGTFEIVPGSKPEKIGASVAQSIYRGLKR